MATSRQVISQTQSEFTRRRPRITRRAAKICKIKAFKKRIITRICQLQFKGSRHTASRIALPKLVFRIDIRRFRFSSNVIHRMGKFLRMLVHSGRHRVLSSRVPRMEHVAPSSNLNKKRRLVTHGSQLHATLTVDQKSQQLWLSIIITTMRQVPQSCQVVIFQLMQLMRECASQPNESHMF